MLFAILTWAARGVRAASRKNRSGQAMVEYMILAAMLVVTASILAVFLYSFRENAGRVIDLAASEYP
jgi:uncharacterized protein (UPF0333 family)